jgi:hypothetical protein
MMATRTLIRNPEIITLDAEVVSEPIPHDLIEVVFVPGGDGGFFYKVHISNSSM